MSDAMNKRRGKSKLSPYFYWGLLLLIVGFGAYFFFKTSEDVNPNEEVGIKIEKKLEQASSSLSTDIKKSEQLLQEAKELSLKNEYSAAEPSLDKLAGKIALEKTDYSTALKHFLEADNIY